MSYPSRREFLRLAGASAGALALPGCGTLGAGREKRSGGEVVNDVHSKLNATRVAAVHSPSSAEEVCELVAAAARRGEAVCIAGGRHAMGGQQFATDAALVSTERLTGVLELDAARGEAEVAAGTCWPELLGELSRLQAGRTDAWGIIQKQTGADRLSIGGALSANAHGRSLARPPFAADVAAFTLVDARGRAVRCSREENSDLFRLAAGGYGLFGVVTSVRLRLMKRLKVRRVVEVIPLEEAMDAFERRLRDGFLYGDFQYGIDLRPAGGRWIGVFSCYQPVPAETPLTERPRELGSDEWLRIVRLCHQDPAETVRAYTAFYLTTSGQVYWSDTHQLSVYVDDYHARLDATHAASSGRSSPGGSEMITETYVPRERFVDFMHAARQALLEEGIHPIYGTVRLIERDDETFLRWATEPWACVIWNLHVDHHPEGIGAARRRFVRLIDLALERSGKYYLTYHRWARRDQVERAYPQMPEFLRRKRELDPEERFQSDWYRHHQDLFAV